MCVMDSDGEGPADTPTIPILGPTKTGDLHALRRAIAEGADLNVEDEEDYTALHWLCFYGPSDSKFGDPAVRDLVACISALVAAGAEVNRIGGHADDYDDQEPCTPLLDVIFELRGRRTKLRAVTTMLLRAGADVQTGTSDGLTPLHIAAIWGIWYNIPTLLAAGAEMDAMYLPIFGGTELDDGSKRPKTPLDSAIRWVLAGREAPSRAFGPLLRAGARIPTDVDLPPYVEKVVNAGGYARYERAHRTRLAAIFIPKLPIPAEVVHHIVSIWADCGGH